MQDRRRIVLGVSGIRDGVERFVLDLHELRRVTGPFARVGDDRDDRLADEAHLADGERVVLQVRAGRRGELEEGVGERRDLFAGQRPVHAGGLLGLRHVDRGDVRMCVRRAHEVDVTHAVTLDVVDEHSLALDEPAVLLARDALPRPGLLGRFGLDAFRRGRRRAHEAAALTASKMFQ